MKNVDQIDHNVFTRETAQKWRSRALKINIFYILCATPKVRPTLKPETI